MSTLGVFAVLGLACAGSIIAIALYSFKTNSMRKKELYIYLATGAVFVGVVLAIAPVTVWGRYDVSGVVEEVHPEGLLELSGGRVVRVGDDRVVTLRQGDRVEMRCETVQVSSGNEACRVKW